MDSLPLSLHFGIIPRIEEWAPQDLAIDNLLLWEKMFHFYDLSAAGSRHFQEHPNRPYVWSMSVSSLDGVIAFQEPGSSSKDVSLHSLTDWRLLNLGWSMADAVLTSGEVLRREANVRFDPTSRFPELSHFRRTLSPHRTHSIPLHVIVSASGEGLNLRSLSPLCDPTIKVLIATTHYGLCKISELFYKQMDDPNETDLDISLCRYNTSISVIESVSGGVDWEKLLFILKHSYSVNYLDVSAGGNVISSLISRHLIDEVRLTISSHFISPVDSQRFLRPTIFPLSLHNALLASQESTSTFLPGESPLVVLEALRFEGLYHIFIRGRVEYRHQRPIVAFDVSK